MGCKQKKKRKERIHTSPLYSPFNYDHSTYQQQLTHESMIAFRSRRATLVSLRNEVPALIPLRRKATKISYDAT